MMTNTVWAESAPPGLSLAPLARAQAAGPDLPPVGRSLFDFLTAVEVDGESSYQVPFPFERFVEQLRGLLGTNGQALKASLIPLGRSLQRSGGAPDYFHFPRVVVAITDNPAGTFTDDVAPQPQWLLKDRLYLAYQEQMKLIEVISYNEAAGRFEFQVVKNYGPGLIPEVFYTSRLVCGACHQSHSPIFSKAPWDETAANPLISALLKRERAQFYGIDPDHGVDISAQFDAATDRAAYFSVYHQLWGPGCALDNSAAEASQCRRALLRELLRRRLTSGVGEDAQGRKFRDQLLARWDQVWPNGLLIPDVNLPNRSPLQGHRPSAGKRFTPIEFGHLRHYLTHEIGALAGVDPVFEPGNPRAPLMRLTAKDMQGDRYAWLLGGMANTLSGSDIRRLDQQLVALRDKPQAEPVDESQTEVLTGKCTSKLLLIAEQSFTKLRCRYSSAAESGKLTLRLPVVIDDTAELPVGHISQLTLGGRRLAQLVLRPNPHQPASWWVTSELNGLHARFADGWAMDQISLLPATQTSPDKTEEGGGLRISIRLQNDFQPLDQALQRMLVDKDSATANSLTLPVLQQSAVMADLYQQLAMPEIDRCCSDITGMPAAQFSASLSPELPLQ